MLLLAFCAVKARLLELLMLYYPVCFSCKPTCVGHLCYGYHQWCSISNIGAVDLVLLKVGVGVLTVG